MTLIDALLSQADSCEALESPFMGRLFRLLAANWPNGSAIDTLCGGWSGDIGPYAASLPLRLAGGLHALVLGKADAELAACYPPRSVGDAQLAAAVLAAFDRHADFFADWMQNAPQTNEVRRSVALIPAAHLLARKFDLPFMTSELGASAGLNLMWHRFAVDTPAGMLGPKDPALQLAPDWSGPAPAKCLPVVMDHRGVDLNPLDAHDPDQQLRIFSYLWADQPHRVDLTRAAIDALDTQVDQGDAIDWLGTRLKRQPDNHLHLIYHTVAWQYFPEDRQAQGTAMIEAAGANATDTRPVAWLGMETDGNTPGAALTLRYWPGDVTVQLARVDFHGRWIDWSVTDLS